MVIDLDEIKSEAWLLKDGMDGTVPTCGTSSSIKHLEHMSVSEPLSKQAGQWSPIQSVVVGARTTGNDRWVVFFRFASTARDCTGLFITERACISWPACRSSLAYADGARTATNSAK